MVSRPVSTDFTVTLALATTAPFGSVTLPLIWPVALWANAAAAIMAIANTTDRNASAPVAAARLSLVLLMIKSFLNLLVSTAVGSGRVLLSNEPTRYRGWY